MEREEVFLASVNSLSSAGIDIKTEIVHTENGIVTDDGIVGSQNEIAAERNVKYELQDNIVCNDEEENDIQSDFEDSIFGDDGEDDIDNEAGMIVGASVDKLKLGNTENYINVKSFKNYTTKVKTEAVLCEPNAFENYPKNVVKPKGRAVGYEDHAHRREDSDEDYVYPGTSRQKSKVKKRKISRKCKTNFTTSTKNMLSNKARKSKHISCRNNDALYVRQGRDTFEKDVNNDLNKKRKNTNVRDVGSQCNIYTLDPVKNKIINELNVLNELFHMEARVAIDRRHKKLVAASRRNVYCTKINESSDSLMDHVNIKINFSDPASEPSMEGIQLASSSPSADFADELKVLNKTVKGNDTVEILIG